MNNTITVYVDVIVVYCVRARVRKKQAFLGFVKEVLPFMATPAKRDKRGIRKEDWSNSKYRDNHITAASCDDMISILSLVQESREMEKRNGRPPRFETVEQLEAAIAEFWQYIAEKNAKGVFLIPDVEGLCTFIRVSRETFNGWGRENYKGFSAIVEKAKNDIAYCKKQLALRGKIPAVVFAIDVNNNHGYKQKQEIELTPKVATTDELTADELQKRIEGDVVIDSTAQLLSATTATIGTIATIDYEEEAQEL